MAGARDRHAFVAGIVASLLILGPAVSPAAAQDAPETRLTLGFDNQKPGTEVAVALVLDVPSGVSVGSTTSEIRFPNTLVSFQQAKKGFAAELARADVAAVSTVDAKAPEYSVVKVTVSSKQRLQPGALADLVFKISDTAAAGQKATLAHAAKAFALADPATAIAPFSAADGAIEVTSSAPIIACFFYMH